MQRVDAGPIRQAVQEYLSVNGNEWTDICRELGWMQSPTKPESARLQRTLGLRPEGSKKRVRGKMKRKRELSDKKVNYNTAINIIRAIDRSPNEFDL